MIPAIRSEFRKLLSVRSTYFIVLISMVITAFFAGLVQGFKIDKLNLVNPHYLETQSSGAIAFVGLILAFAGLLLAGHEYRYNTIMYTLTTANRRWKVLVAKVFVITIFAVFTSLLIIFFSPLCTMIGVHLKGGTQLVHQSYAYSSLIWHCIYVGWGYAMYAFILLIILRNQVGAIVTYLMIPLIGENILSLLLKSNTKYLPFTSLQGVVGQADERVSGVPSIFSLKVSLAYIIVGLLVGAVLFAKRDAS